MRTTPKEGSIFFSYKRDDGDYANEIELIFSGLEAAGLPMFRDVDDLVPGSNWEDALEEAIQKCVCGVSLFTPDSLGSKVIRAEVQELANMNKLIPVALDMKSIPLSVRPIHAINLSDWTGDVNEKEWNKLVSLLKKRVSVADVSPAKEQPLPFEGDEPTSKEIATLHRRQRMPSLEISYFRDALDLPLLVRVPAGSRIVQTSDRRQVPIMYEKDFGMSVTPITFRQWNHAATSGAKHVDVIETSSDDEDRPVTSVSWLQARAYTSWLNARCGFDAYRLPDEAMITYCSLDDIAPSQHLSTNNDKPSYVTAMKANRYGLKGLVGTIWQWTANSYEDAHADQIHQSETESIVNSELKTVRGGSWRSPVRDRTNLARSGFEKSFRRRDIGFRVYRQIEL